MQLQIKRFAGSLTQSTFDEALSANAADSGNVEDQQTVAGRQYDGYACFSMRDILWARQERFHIERLSDL